ncbi:sigma-70 family RNA polymerase sigma factor [Mycobacterium scrofulaceum]|uniref:RNA polymerase subunit sigma n=1 Tax=Mycobacterium scrofulaceum TaxID=1783 RepID=A0A1X0JZD4_MYCSC|nr:sigma-70 family RNA polymerase sigma factor [Mycobacterium scrofulaceum]ORB68284.1 RNA polymerase subunit sigma [Mycobacterium scrofulaceum]
MTGPPPSGTELDALLHKVARGDSAAFAAVYDLTKSRVYGMVMRVLRDSGYSEETTQEIYCEIWRSARDYDSSKGSALSWLLTIAHRRAVDRVRSEEAFGRRESRYAATSADPASDVVSEAAIAGDERRRVVECLGALTDTQRECIQLAYYDGLSYSQVSERLAANLSTIKSRMRDALRALRNCLEVP